MTASRSRSGRSGTAYRAWALDTVIPMKETESRRTGKDRTDCMNQFRAAWDRFCADPARSLSFWAKSGSGSDEANPISRKRTRHWRRAQSREDQHNSAIRDVVAWHYSHTRSQTAITQLCRISQRPPAEAASSRSAPTQPSGVARSRCRPNGLARSSVLKRGARDR